MWIDVARHHWTDTTNGHEKPKMKRIHIVYEAGNSTMGNGKHDASIVVSAIWDGLQRINKDFTGF